MGDGSGTADEKLREIAHRLSESRAVNTGLTIVITGAGRYAAARTTKRIRWWTMAIRTCCSQCGRGAHRAQN
jgi:hypothetical protein